MRGAERSQPSLTPAERELEEALRELNPAASGINRDRLLFDAGAAVEHARTRRLGWVAAALAAGLALSLLWRPEPRVVDRLVHQSPSAEERDDRSTQVEHEGRFRPSTAPVMVASLTSVPFPMPGGSFVRMPPGLVGRIGVEPGAMATTAYFTKIQGVLQNGWAALPPSREQLDAVGDDATDNVPAPGAPTGPTGGASQRG